MAVVLVAAVPDAKAGDGTTVSVGARTRGGRPIVVGEYWPGRFGFSAEVGADRFDREQTRERPGDVSDVTSDDGWSASVGGGIYYAVARGKRAQMSVGVRVSYRHFSADGEGRDASASVFEAAIPIRVELWVDSRVSVYTELGVGMRTVEQSEDGGGLSNFEVETEEMFVFGDPLGNAGVSFHF